MAGVTLGFAILLVGCAAGLGLVFVAVPSLQVVLKIAGVVYMLWLAFKVATAHSSNDERALARPFTFLQAIAFQWINSKVVVAALSGIAFYVRPGHERSDFSIMLGVLTMTTLGSVLTWTGFGVASRQLLRDPAQARLFNAVMALLLVATIVPMVV
jgi:threonine/homoserine/homoserine lactone efflux protein